MVGICAERGLCISNTYFKHIINIKYTRVGRSGVEVMNMIDLVLVVLCKDKLVGTLIKKEGGGE